MKRSNTSKMTHSRLHHFTYHRDELDIFSIWFKNIYSFVTKIKCNLLWGLFEHYVTAKATTFKVSCLRYNHQYLHCISICGGETTSAFHVTLRPSLPKEFSAPAPSWFVHSYNSHVLRYQCLKNKSHIEVNLLFTRLLNLPLHSSQAIHT